MKPIRSIVGALASLLAIVPLSAQWTSVPSVNFSAIQASQFTDQELEVPYFLNHFAQVANAVVETGTDKGFLNIKVNRDPADNQPYNARVMEMQAVLAYFYTANRPWNPYYGNASVRVRLEAMLDRWTKIQNQPGSTDGNFDGLFTEYSPSNWSLAPTSFGAMHAAFALEAISASGRPFDATILDNARVALRQALIALYTRADIKATAKQYSNQLSGSFYASLVYLARWPDATLDAAFTAAVADSIANDQSPAGFHYENAGSDIGYSGVHENNLRIALPRLLLRPDLLNQLNAADAEWNNWLGANLVPQPGSSPLLYLANSGINSRTTHSYQTPDDRPYGEFVPASRSFATTTTEFAANLVTRRSQVQAQFGNWGALSVPSAFSYNTGFVFDAYTALNTWQPTPARRTGAFNQLPYFASERFNRVFHDPTALTVATARRPSYYGIFNSGVLRVSGQNFGLGLLWNDRFGTALQSVSATPWAWGTSRTGGDGSVYENSALTVTRTLNGSAFSPATGITTLADGTFAQQYPLGSFGNKTVSFTNDRVDVNLTHTGAFTELLPIVHPPNATLTQTSNSLTVRQTNGSTFTVSVTGGNATFNVGATSALGAGNLLRRLVTLSGSGSLRYELALTSGLPPLSPAAPSDVALLANDTAASNPLTLASVSFAPPEAASAQPHGKVVIDAASAPNFATSDLAASGATPPGTLASLPGFTVLTAWSDTQSPANAFAPKGTLTGITNYHARTGAAQTALRFQLDTLRTDNTSAGAFTTSATLTASPGDALYVGAVNSTNASLTITFGRYASLSQNATTLGFSTTSTLGHPVAARAAGFIVTGVGNTRTFTATFLGLRGQILATQSGTGGTQASGAKIHFGLDAGSDPAGWISAIVLRGNNASANIGLDDFGFTPPVAVDVGTASIANNQLRYTPSATYFGPLRYSYTYTFPDGTAATTASGSGELLLDSYAANWTNLTPGLSAWSTAANWSVNAPPSTAASTTNQLYFFSGLTLPASSLTANNDLGVSTPVQSLTLSGTAPTSGNASVSLSGQTLFLSAPGARALTMSLDATQSGIGTLAHIISTPLALSADLSIIGTGNASFTVSGPVSGAAALLKSGTAAFALTGNNSYSGGTTLSGGSLLLGSDSALGSGPLSLAAASALGPVAGSTPVLPNLVFLSANTVLSVPSGMLTLAGVVSDDAPRNLTKSGPGTLVLSANNTFRGSTTISEGTLRVAHPSALGNSAAKLFLPGGTALGTLELANNITFSRSIELAMHNTPGHAQLRNSSGDNTYSGTLSLNAGGARWDITSLAGSLSLTGPISNIVSSSDTWRTLYLNGPASGALTGNLSDSPNSKLNLTVSSGSWTLAGTPKSHSGTTTVSGGTLTLNTSMVSGITVQAGGVLSGNGSTSSNLTVQTGATLTCRAANWNSLPSGISVNQIIATGATSWKLRLDSAGIQGFTESARTLPLVNASGGFINVNAANILIETPGFPGTGTWSVATGGNSLALVYAPDLYATWVDGYAWAGKDSSMGADPDADGVVNLLEYSLNGNPLDPGSIPLPVAAIVDGFLTISFQRVADPDLRYDVRASSTPGGIATDWETVWTSTGSANIAGMVVVADIPPSPSPARRFLHLRVTRTGSSGTP
jgi:autotransporter-associated beta strand protein